MRYFADDLANTFKDYEELFEHIDKYRNGSGTLLRLTEYVFSIESTFIPKFLDVGNGSSFESSSFVSIQSTTEQFVAPQFGLYVVIMISLFLLRCTTALGV